MTIAEQLKRAKADLDAVYAAGKAAGGGGTSGPNLLNYISASWSGNFKLMFYQAAFPDGYEVTLDIPNPPTNINSMFRLATGLRKITFTVPTDRQYDARYFLTTDSSATPTLEELVLPDGIKFSAFDYFASYARKLHTITGTIDLSESTSNLNCFMYCTDLVNARFAENSIKSSFYIKQSAKLSDDTRKSIVYGLATVETTQTLTVNEAVYRNMSETEEDTIKEKNWTLVY